MSWVSPGWLARIAAVAGCVLAGATIVEAREGPTISRTSRPGAGTVVGITIAGAVPEGAVDAALATWESELSEWDPGSTTSRVMRGETVPFAGE